MENAPAAAIILAAGKGTRMKSAHPKVLHPLAGKALLGHALDAVTALNPKALCVVIRHEREAVAQYVNSYCPQAILADQDEIPGTGRAVQCALQKLGEQGQLNGTVVITSGDVPLLESATLENLLETQQQTGNQVTILTTLVPDPTGYGRIIRSETGAVTAIVEDRDCQESQRQIREINAGIYAFDAEFLTHALSGLGTDNDQGEVYLTDTIALAAANGRAGTYLLADYIQAEGCNDRVQLAGLHREHNRRILNQLMRDGVSIIDPETTWIEKSVTIAPDAVILPGCDLHGNTAIGSGAEVGPFTSLTDVKVGEGARVRRCDLRAVNLARGSNHCCETNL
ncbi:bifunctional UDP-N-acetylglucosamine diphosphorylase/glucosamine-1-phosphate N-acetyltransferase GlmU [Varibaculum vaginae]|uniref:bifunctional UDP-N-acetylglucosamine diphosphorylase/glucosamine-1-phosphate N-acetyltransferase GlmU n=1 Tax=Varibaculum vaginae TaxID=2364797 RepID=UPI000F07C202|nr:NTP transferase domain-containing protein [Varibaculum vaginae]